MFPGGVFERLAHAVGEDLAAEVGFDAKAPQAAEAIPQSTPAGEKSRVEKSPFVTRSETPPTASAIEIHSSSVMARRSEYAVQPVMKSGPVVTVSAAVAALASRIERKKVS